MMNVAVKLLALATIPLWPLHGQQDASGPCSRPPALQAVQRSDNDVSFSTHEGPRVTIPALVQDKIRALAAEACFQTRAYSTDTLPLSWFYAGAFVLRSPDGSRVYVFNRTNELGFDTFFFILFDSATNRLTPTPVAIYAKWARDEDEICQRPFVTFEDLDRDGQLELVVREVTHNGTSYNACVRHYYRVGRDLSLGDMFAVEERSLQDGPTAETWLLRRVRFLSPDSLLIATILSVPGQQERKIGEVVLTRHATARYHTTNYRVESTHILDRRYSHSLITDSGEPDESFTLTGRTLWY